ncbi:MAG: AraC-like DNA-binding protein [Clostridium sp.]|jgi:AraC-like DNA-binding protein
MTEWRQDEMIQSFVKSNKKNISLSNIDLRLLYACKTEKSESVLPRVMHVHNDRLEIMFICEGSGLYTIGKSKYLVGTGDILIYNSGTIHDEVCDPTAKIKSYCLGIGQVQVDGFDPNCLINSEDCPILKASNHFTLVHSIFSTIYNELYCENDSAEETCHYLTKALIILLLQMSKRVIHIKKESEQKLGERIKTYIDKNYNNEITLASISEALNISLYYMSHTFKEITGYAPIEYIMRRRIGKAQTLLITTKHSITMIANMVAYDNSSYFNRIFTKNVGMSPKHYRECYTKKQDSTFLKK